MPDGQEMLAHTLGAGSLAGSANNVLTSESDRERVRINQASKYLHLIDLDVHAGAAVENIVIRAVLVVAVCGHGPDDVLEAHGRFHVRRRVEGAEITGRMDDGGVGVVFLEVLVMTGV